MKHPILEQISRLEFLLHRYYGHQHHMASPHRGQGRILSILKMQPEISQKELTFLLDMRKQSLGELLAKLEQKGYITREGAEEDRRALNIKLTEEGARAADRIAAEEPAKQKDILAALDAQEQEQLSGYLQRLVQALEAEVGSEGPHHHGGHGHGRHGQGRCRGMGHGHHHGGKDCGTGHSEGCSHGETPHQHGYGQ